MLAVAQLYLAGEPLGEGAALAQAPAQVQVVTAQYAASQAQSQTVARALAAVPGAGNAAKGLQRARVVALKAGIGRDLQTVETEVLGQEVGVADTVHAGGAGTG